MNKESKMKKYVKIIYLTGIFIVALCLRIWWIKNVPTFPVFDFKTYQEIATNIFWGAGHTLEGEPIAFQGMGYPVVLGFFYRIIGKPDIMAAKYLNVCLSMLTIICTYFILIKLTKRKFVIYTAYTIVALLPNYIAYTNVIGTEVFITFLFSVIILLQIYSFDHRIQYSLLGIFIGAAALTKPFFMAYPVIASISFWLREKDIKRTACLFLSVMILMIGIIAPWTYRNYKKFGRFIPVSYNSGYVFYLNNNPYNANGAWMPIKDVYASEDFRKKINEILQDGKRSEKVAHELEVLFKPKAKGWIKENPMEFFKLGIIRLKSTFFGGTWDLDAWAQNDQRPIEEKYKGWNKEQKIAYLRHKNFVSAIRDTMIYVLSSFGFIYILLNVENILLGLFKKDVKLTNEMIIPTLNSAFFIAVYFVYEGQPRYNFPVLFIFAMSTSLCLDMIRRAIAIKNPSC